MAQDHTTTDAYPPKADLLTEVLKPLPLVPPGTVDTSSMTSDEITERAKAVLNNFNAAISNSDIAKLLTCFNTEQFFWRDNVALTSHARTFTTAEAAAAAFLHLWGKRGLGEGLELVKSELVVMNLMLIYIDCQLSFRSSSPAQACAGRALLLPTKAEGISDDISWNIWCLSTWVEELIDFPEDETLLGNPGLDLSGTEPIKPDVCIIGAGSAGLSIATKLKALGIEAVLLERNRQPGDCWAKRYDCLELHIPTGSCELPYSRYPKEWYGSHLVTRDEISGYLNGYAEKFHLNVISQAEILGTTYDSTEKLWTVRFKIGDGPGERCIICRHIIQATGSASDHPYIPPIKQEEQYKGFELHSIDFRNAQALVNQGIKSVAIVGAGSSAFDIMADCYKAGLTPTMVARSPTYIIPLSYAFNPNSFGRYNALPAEVADRAIFTLPETLGGQLMQALLMYLASQEPDRYRALAEAGYPVMHFTDPKANLLHHLLERAGGHYVDVGATELVASRKVSVRGHVEPVSYTETGVRLSDGSVLDADAIIWCTGFAGIDMAARARDVLGGKSEETKQVGPREDGVLGAAEVAGRLDGAWGVDKEGEIRGMWKRHLRMENYWVSGGAFMHQRWYSKFLAQQIKMELEGCLPPAYRETPGSVVGGRVSA